MITEWTRRTQNATREIASNNGEGWTIADLEFVTTFTNDATDAEIAITLGRTLYAIQSLRVALDAGKRVGSTRTKVSAYRGWTEGDGDE